MKNLGTKNTAEDLASVGLGIQNAEVGQVVMVGSVDADGQPIGYESKELYPTDPREFDSSPIFTGDQVGIDGTPLPNVLNALDDAKVDKTKVAETFIEQIRPSSGNITFATEEELAEKVDKTKVAETFIEQIQPSSESMAFASQGYVDSKLAPVETSPATAAHTTGSLLLYSGTLYRATADIAVGATLTVGTNIAVTDVNEQTNLLKSALNAKPDIDLGITGASAGQVATVKTVDGNGKPTAWEGNTALCDYELISNTTLTEDITSFEFAPEGQSYTKLLFLLGFPATSSSVSKGCGSMQINGNPIRYGGNSSSTLPVYDAIRIEYENGIIKTDAGRSINFPYILNVPYYNNQYTIGFVSASAISKVKFIDSTWLTGSVIKIYGVR